MGVIIYVAIAAVLLIGASVVLPAFVGGAWSPTTMTRVRAMLHMARLQPGDTVYDLGAGDGRVVIAAAKQFGARAVGVEVDPLKTWLCRLRIGLAGLQDRVRIDQANFFNVDLRGADVVTFYLSQAAADKLQAKFAEELKPGARIVSHGRPLPRWIPTEVDEEHRLYLYVVQGAAQIGS